MLKIGFVVSAIALAVSGCKALFGPVPDPQHPGQTAPAAAVALEKAAATVQTQVQPIANVAEATTGFPFGLASSLVGNLLLGVAGVVRHTAAGNAETALAEVTGNGTQPLTVTPKTAVTIAKVRRRVHRKAA